jgi:hypothetical protein
MGQAIVDFFLECLMLLFQFREVRLHRHAECLLNQWLPDEVSLAQTGRKGDRMSGFASQQTEPKPLIGGYFARALNSLVENAIIPLLLPVS